MNIQKGIFIENRYEILERIGSGGMSDVYKARDDKLNRFVAIKFLKPEFCEDKNFVKNFQIEAQSAAALLHPNVVGVYDVNQADGIYYIVMEYVDGITLKKYIDRNGKLPVKEATSIAIQIAQGIDAAHNAHIVHRDIKPQNVLISREGKIKVTDFGIARTTTANTISSDILGSVQYISPEQARGGQVDNRTDIYSFGIVYYEMVTGELPFDGDSTVSIALKHIQENVPLVSDIVPGIPSSVSRIIEKCTQRKPDRRYQKITSLLSDLKTSLITPNEDFVVLEPEPSESATIIMSEEDAEILRREGERVLGPDTRNTGYQRPRSGQKSTYSSSRDRNTLRTGNYGTYRNNNYRYSSSKNTGRSSSVSSGTGSRSYSRGRTSRRKSDRILVVSGIIAGIVIVILLVVVVLTTFSPGGCAGIAPESETETQTETTVAAYIEMPSVVGMQEEQAVNTLQTQGLIVTTSYQESESVAQGYVVSQSADMGSNLEKGQTVNLVVSSGKGLVVLDDFAGQDKESVVIRLENQGFRVQVTEEKSQTVDKGLILRTVPEAGSEVSRDSVIELIVSNGLDAISVTVPDVIGYSEEDASSLLYGASLSPWISYEERSGMGGVVFSQDPAAGTSVEEWSGIRIVVGVEPAQQDYQEYDYQEDWFSGTDWEDSDYSDEDYEIYD